MGVKFSGTIERIRLAGKLKNNSEVAWILSVTPQAISNYKKRGELPTDLVFKFAASYSLSLDWLIAGEGQMYKPGKGVEEGLTGCPAAAVETTGHGEEGAGRERRFDSAVLSPDEIIRMGKLLKILRGPDKCNLVVIKYTVDAFLKPSGQPSR